MIKKIDGTCHLLHILSRIMRVTAPALVSTQIFCDYFIAGRSTAYTRAGGATLAATGGRG